jgi:triacylglycerol lipase
MHPSYLAPFATILTGVFASVRTVAEPAITVKNGTYVGIHSSIYNQDLFLGIPYARPPIGDLRFRIPQSLNTTWTGVRPAKEYSAEVRAQNLCKQKSD